MTIQYSCSGLLAARMQHSPSGSRNVASPLMCNIAVRSMKALDPISLEAVLAPARARSSPFLSLWGSLRHCLQELPQLSDDASVIAPHPKDSADRLLVPGILFLWPILESFQASPITMIPSLPCKSFSSRDNATVKGHREFEFLH